MITDEIVKWAAETKLENIPPEVLSLAKKHILDGIGVTLAGSQEPVAGVVVDCVKELGGRAEASVVSRGLRTSAPLAALANGVMCHALDYDDGSPNWLGHPTAVLLPTLLALGEKSHAPGKSVLEAYVIGFEVGAKLGAIMGEYSYELGWHNTCILGAIGGAVAAAKILGLSLESTRMAVGIAGSMASGLRKNFGTMTKPYQVGLAAHNGIMATLMAKSGLNASDSILEGHLGFGKVFSGGKKELLEDSAGMKLGDPFDIISPGGELKPYPCCRFTHFGIDAALELRQKYQLRVEDIEEIECKTSPAVPQALIYHRPQTGLEAKFSLEYCVNRALLDGKVSLDDFRDDKVCQASVQGLIKKVRYTHPEGWSPKALAPQELVVRLKGKREYSQLVEVPKGGPGNPMEWSETEAKFMDCSTLVVSPDKAKIIRDMVSRLEEIEDIGMVSEKLL